MKCHVTNHFEPSIGQDALNYPPTCVSDKKSSNLELDGRVGV